MTCKINNNDLMSKISMGAVNNQYLIEVLTVGLILSADSFSAAIAMGHRPFSRIDALRFAIASGGAEALVALAGSIAGSQIIRRFEAVDHWIAFFLLTGVAIHMAYEGMSDMTRKEIREEKLNFHSFTKVLIVSFATSLDALGVGIGLGISSKPITPFIFSIGFWAFMTTLMGLYLAKKLSQKFGPVMNLLGAAVLEIVAFQMLKI